MLQQKQENVRERESKASATCVARITCQIMLRKKKNDASTQTQKGLKETECLRMFLLLLQITLLKGSSTYSMLYKRVRIFLFFLEKLFCFLFSFRLLLVSAHMALVGCY